MTKLTRHQQFTLSFDKFIDTVIETEGLPDLEYKLKSYTENQTCRDHEYAFTIPRQIVSYTITNGHDSQTVYKRQTIPSSQMLKTLVDSYFFGHRLKMGDTFMSWTDIVNMGYTNNDEENGDFTAKLEVSYFKSHIPYPICSSDEEDSKKKVKLLEKQVKELTEELTMSKQLYNLMSLEADKNRRLIRRERRIVTEKYAGLFEKMQNKMREYYKLSDKPEECPVCYENIESSKLKVPGCCHLICTDCSSRCTACPMCREDYISVA